MRSAAFMYHCSLVSSSISFLYSSVSEESSYFITHTLDNYDQSTRHDTAFLSALLLPMPWRERDRAAFPSHPHSPTLLPLLLVLPSLLLLLLLHVLTRPPPPSMTLEPYHLRGNSSSRKIIPATTTAATDSDDLAIRPPPPLSSFKRFPYSKHLSKPHKLASLIRSLSTTLLPFKTFLPSCRWSKLPSSSSSSFSSPSSRRVPALGKKVTGTLFGHRRGHVNFMVQDEPGSEPALLLELAMPTSSLVKEMASGLVRLALECERASGKPLFGEPFWTMYCNGRKSGYAMSRECGESDQKVLGLLRAVSVGAGVLPLAQEGGELMYMRARFERVVGSSDPEAFYMMNPDGNGGPELSIFLIRI